MSSDSGLPMNLAPESTLLKPPTASTKTSTRWWKSIFLDTTLAASLMVVALPGAAVGGPLEDAASAYNHRDYATAMRMYRLLADKGDPIAQDNLGTMYDNGQGVPQDSAEAMKWYRKAADQGNATAQLNVGSMYDNGQGVPQDYAEAVNWYRKAADQGNATAQLNVGIMYDKGDGVPQDSAEAMKWYRKAADQMDAAASNRIGLLYYSGRGVRQDFAEARKWFDLAASRFPASEAQDRDAAIRNRDRAATKMTAVEAAGPTRASSQDSGNHQVLWVGLVLLGLVLVGLLLPWVLAGRSDAVAVGVATARSSQHLPGASESTGGRQRSDVPETGADALSSLIGGDPAGEASEVIVASPGPHHAGQPIREEVGIERPRSVRIATNLLWIAFGIGLLQAGVSLGIDGAGQLELAVTISTLLLFGLLIYQISLGRNWARVLWLVLMVIGIAGGTPLLLNVLNGPTVRNALTLMQYGLQLYATVLLFIEPASTWFRARDVKARTPAV